MSIKKDYINKFDKEKQTMLILVGDYIGYSKIDTYVIHSVEFVSSINLKNGKVSNDKGRIEWITKDNSKTTQSKYHFEKYKVYKIKTRKIKQNELESNMTTSMSNCHLVLKVLEENVQNEYLNNLAEQFKLPVELEIDKIKFQLNRQFSWYETNQTLLGHNVDIFLRCDENLDTANKSSARFKIIYPQIQQINDNICQLIIDKYMNLINEYREPKPLSKQEFKNLITLNNILFNNNGTIELLYDDGNEFGEHAIQVKINDANEITSINIVG